MALNINMPKEAEDTLREAFGENLDAQAREALAVEAYRQGKLSLGQFARILGIDTYTADGTLKQRGIMLNYTADDLRQDVATLERLLAK